MTLTFLLPVWWAANCGVFGLVFAVVSGAVSGATWQRRMLGALAGLSALVLLAWLSFAWLGTPSDYPSPFCRDNVPPWWPSWIPA